MKEGTMTEPELKKMTVKKLREFASKNTELSDISGLKKDALITAIVEALGVDAPKKQTSKDESKKETGKKLSKKKEIKIEIVRLKQKKEELLKQKTKKSGQIRNIRRRVRNLKRMSRRVS